MILGDNWTCFYNAWASFFYVYLPRGCTCENIGFLYSKSLKITQKNTQKRQKCTQKHQKNHPKTPKIHSKTPQNP
jgi:hypothetical protein